MQTKEAVLPLLARFPRQQKRDLWLQKGDAYAIHTHERANISCQDSQPAVFQNIPLFSGKVLPLLLLPLLLLLPVVFFITPFFPKDTTTMFAVNHKSSREFPNSEKLAA